MKPKDLRDLTDEELAQRLVESRQELFNLRFQAATGALENTARLKLAKREIARILTVQHDRNSQKQMHEDPSKLDQSGDEAVAVATRRVRPRCRQAISGSRRSRTAG